MLFWYVLCMYMGKFFSIWVWHHALYPGITNHQACLCKDADCGLCNWPWQLFSLQKRWLYLICDPNNQCIPVKNTFSWCVVMFCVGEVVWLFSVVFFVVWVLHKFDLGFVIIGKNYIMQWQRLMFLTGSVYFILTDVASIKGLYQAMRVNCILLSNGH
jgi:hypothetical protein